MRTLGRRMISIIMSVITVLSCFAGLTFSVCADNGTDMKKTVASMSVGDTITFGSYPQTDVTSELGTELTAAAPSTDEWTSYDYYYDGEQSDYMKYYDLSYNGDRYRGVYFTKYRQWYWNFNTKLSMAIQSPNDYFTNNVYWFKYDPLTWRILDPSTGYIMCEDIIDSQPFNDKYYINENDNQLCYNDETYTNYANNWEYSTIRRWLNETFFVAAFSTSERSQIPCTKLTTPAYSTSCSQYDVGETGDYVFLPSYRDMINSSYGFSSDYSYSDINRRAHSSDYAKSQGVYCHTLYKDKCDKYASDYCLRSAGSRSCYTIGVKYSGEVCEYWNTHYADDGIRPALCFNPTSTATPPNDSGDGIKQTISSMSVGDTITFGSYPQTEVTSELGSELTAAAPSTDEWTSYDYYYDGKQSDFMKYYDLSYNGSRYRGVYFTQYRPYYWNATDSAYQSTYQADNGYNTNNVYWFRYDPLTWRILDPSTGYVICEDIIDSQAFNDKYYEYGNDVYGYIAYYNDETYTHYANNWEYSTIRSWLNNKFFVTAFSPSERSQIPCAKLTTPAYSTECSEYDVGETFDYVFLPSYQDMVNPSYGFSYDRFDEEMNRRAHSSDYAKSQGIYVEMSCVDKYNKCTSFYCLRSAGDRTDAISGVGNYGNVDYVWYSLSSLNNNIRPALCFNPTSTATPPKTGEYEIKLYSNVPAMIVGKGRTIGAVVQLEHNGKVVDGEGETAYSVVSSNNDIVSTEDISNASDGTSFLINGVEEGEAVITITEHNSGAILSVKVQVDQGILTFNAATLPSYYNRKNEYNGCISGMYIDEFKMTEKDSDNMSVTFNVYNTVNIVGSVDVYGADGKIIRSKQIKRFDGGFVTSITDALVTGYKLIENTVTGDILTYKQEDYSTKTPITVDVPKGGHIEITNDPLYSNTCAVYNFSEFITTSILMFGDVLSVSAETKKEISAQTGKNIVDKFLKQYIASMSGNTCNDKIAKLGEKFVKKLTEKSLKKILASGITGELATFVDDGKAILKECDIDLEKEITSAAGSIGISILEGNLRKAMGPFGSVLDGMFKFTEYLSYTCFLVDVCKVHDDHAFCIYFNDKNGCLCNNEVTVKSYEEDVDLSKLNFVMHSVVMSNDTDLTGYMKDALNKLSDKYIVRNIYLERDGKISQPGQYVQVSIPVPENWSPDRCKLYWVQDDGTLQEISVTVSAGRLEFVTNHFSYYAIVYNEDSAGASEKLEFADNSNIDGRIDEENNRVSVFPSSNAGISFDEFKAMFKGIISVAGEKIEKVFNGMKFMFGDKEYTLILKGDANADSKINASDARTILRIAARLEQPDEITKDAADIDSDGKITSAEARSVLRFAAKLQNKIYE